MDGPNSTIYFCRYRRYGIKNLSESLEYETKQRSRRLLRKRAEKLRIQQKSSTSSSLQANTNVDSPLDSITSFEQSGMLTLSDIDIDC